MRRPLDFLRNFHAVIASAAGVTLLVASALGWLGWRVLSQERALEQQRRRDRLEQTADGLLAGSLRALTEAEVRLAQVGSARPWNLSDPPPGGVAVLVGSASVETRPAGVLVYVPVLPNSPTLDESQFQQAEQLEFRDKDYAQTEAALRKLITTANPRVRTEALLRLARVQAKRGNTPGALYTYGQLRTEDGVSSAEVPYALLARFARCKLLAGAGANEAFHRETADLLAGLDAGRWPLRKHAYLYYATEVRGFGTGSSGSLPSSKLAVSDVVQALWEEWESGGRRQLRPGRRVFESGKDRALVLANSTPDRIAALVYPQNAIQQLVAGSGWNRSLRDGIAASVLDENGHVVFGSLSASGSRSGGMRASRTLAAAQLPWKIQLETAGDARNALLFTGRERLYIAGLTAIALVVGLASYTMARGVLREIHAAQLQSDFVSAVSHEFRSPLTTLSQLTELLAHGRIRDESRRRTYFDVLQNETARLNHLVENLLDFGRMEAGRRQYRFEAIDLYELAREAVADYEEEITGSGYKLELNGGSGTPVRVDREALRRVVRNLLENAVKYSPECRTVWIEAGEENGAAVLRVRDQGIGIPQQEQCRVFDKFVRGHAAKEACIQGTGIGLAMVKQLVNAHSGEVLLASAVGEGSTFTVRLPLNGCPRGSAR